MCYIYSSNAAITFQKAWVVINSSYLPERHARVNKLWQVDNSKGFVKKQEFTFWSKSLNLTSSLQAENWCRIRIFKYQRCFMYMKFTESSCKTYNLPIHIIIYFTHLFCLHIRSPVSNTHYNTWKTETAQINWF